MWFLFLLLQYKCVCIVCVHAVLQRLDIPIRAIVFCLFYQLNTWKCYYFDFRCLHHVWHSRSVLNFHCYLNHNESSFPTYWTDPFDECDSFYLSVEYLVFVLEEPGFVKFYFRNDKHVILGALSLQLKISRMFWGIGNLFVQKCVFNHLILK